MLDLLKKDLKRAFHGVAVVTGFGGQLYAPDLYDRVCLLPERLRAHYRPGQYVDVKAVCNAASGTFEVTSAKAIDTAPIPVATNTERTKAVVRFWLKPLYLPGLRDMLLRANFSAKGPCRIRKGTPAVFLPRRLRADKDHRRGLHFCHTVQGRQARHQDPGQLRR